MSAARDELVSLLWCKPFPYGGAGDYIRPDANAAHAMANAIIAAGYIKPDLTDADRRDRAQDVVLEFNGTPRRELFEYPHRADESRELIAQADRVVAVVLDAMLSPEATA